MNKQVRILVLIGIFFIAFILRFYKLGEVPFGFYQDESAIGYNAYSIMSTGKDEHGASFPLYFKSFGDYKLPVYIYSTIPAIKLFGLNEFAVRFPSALFGFLTIVIFYFLVNKLTKNNSLALIATFLLSINPWHLHYSRATFEVSIGLFLYVLGTYLLVKALEEGKRPTFLLGTMCFIVSLYSYNLTRLLSPLLYFFILYIFGRDRLKVAKSEYIFTTIFSIILLIPFAQTIFSSGGVSSAHGTLISSSAPIQASLLELRSYLITLPTIFTKLFFNTSLLTLWQYIQNIASYFSVPFLFITGSPHGNHGIGNVGQFYLFELPFIIIGISTTLLSRQRWQIFLLGWGVLTILVASLTREAPHATRSFFLLAPLITFSAMGGVSIWQWMKTNKRQKILLIVGCAIIFYNLIYYFSSYYIRFPISYAKSWRSADKPLSLYLSENEAKYEKIIFDKKAGFIYSSLLFYTAYSPQEFQKTANWEPDDSEGFSNVASFGKYEFRDIDWSKDTNLSRTLIVTTNDSKPKELSISKKFTYPMRPVVAAVKQEIIQFPVEDVAYVLVETKK